MAVLTWKHHTLIQALMTRGPLSEGDFRTLFASVTGKNPVSCRAEFNEYLLKINKELCYVQMELRCCRNQNDGQVCYGLVNNVCDEQSKLGTKYSVPQISLFKAVIEAIAQDTTAKGSISTIDALNLHLEVQVQNGTESLSQSTSQVPALRNFSMSQKEKTLDELVRDKWLCRTPNGDFGLGIRSYLDLRSWFNSSGVPSCEVCNEAAVKAKICENEDCELRIHQYCREKIFSQSRGEIVCPSCGIQWRPALPKAEAHVEEDIAVPTESQPSAGSKRKRRRENRDIEEDTIGIDSTQESGTSSRRAARANTVGNNSTQESGTSSKRVTPANTVGNNSTQESDTSSRRVTRASARAR